jgi:hypothetical protein
MNREPQAEPVRDGHTDARMWIEVDLAGTLRAIPGTALRGRIQRLSDRDMTAIQAAAERAPRSAL